MKKFLFFSMIIMLVTMITSCSDDFEQEVLDVTVSNDESIEVLDVTKVIAEKLDEVALIEADELQKRSSTSYYYPNPNGGKCGNTSYLFYLKDYGNDPQRALKLKLPNGNTVYLNMQRWNDYQYISVKIFNCGDVNWSIVHKSTKQQLINNYKLKNTGVDIRTAGTSRLGWVFKYDGSSWQNRQGWREDTGSPAHKNNDMYAQDWNFGFGDGDRGKPINAPFSGQVIFAGWKGNCYGNVVDLVQQSGKKWVKFRVAHLDRIDVSVGQRVTRDDIIGTVGKSGSDTCSAYPAWTSHLHAVLYKVNTNFSVTAPLEYKFSY